MNTALRLLVQHPILTRTLVATITLVSLVGIAKLRFDDDHLSIIRAQDESFRNLLRSFETFGSEERDFLVVVSGDDLLTRAPFDALRRLDNELRRVEGLAVVISLFDARRPMKPGQLLAPVVPNAIVDEAHRDRIRDRLLAHPLVAGRLLSDDAETALFFATVDGNDPIEVEHAEALRDSIRRAIVDAALPSDIDARITGLPAIRADIVNALVRNQALYAAIGVAVALLAALLIYRRIGAVAALGLGPGLGVIWTFGLMGLGGQTINVVNSAVLPALLAIGLSDSLHINERVVLARRQGRSSNDAMTTALHDLIVPCALTSVTTAIGFGSLVVSDLALVRAFGATCALGTIAVFVATILATAATANLSSGSRLLSEMGRPDAARIIAFMTRRARLIVTAASVLCVSLIVVALGLRPDTRMRENLPLGSESELAMELLDREFGGGSFARGVVRWPEAVELESPRLAEVLQAMESVIEEAAGGSAAGRTLSVRDVVHAVSGAPTVAIRKSALAFAPRHIVRRLITERGRSAVVQFPVEDLGTRANAPLFSRIEQGFADLQTSHPGFEISLTGLHVVQGHNTDRLVNTLVHSLVLAVPLMLVVVAIGLRSVRLTVAAILPNLLPPALLAAGLVVSGTPLDLTAVIALTVALGIGIDDTIHFLAHYQKARARGLTLDAALGATWSRLFAIVITTTILLVVAFGATVLGDFEPIRRFGVLLCCALIAALIADLFVLPACVAVAYVNEHGLEDQPGPD